MPCSYLYLHTYRIRNLGATDFSLTLTSASLSATSLDASPLSIHTYICRQRYVDSSHGTEQKICKSGTLLQYSIQPARPLPTSYRIPVSTSTCEVRQSLARYAKDFSSGPSRDSKAPSHTNHAKFIDYSSQKQKQITRRRIAKCAKTERDTERGTPRR